MKISELTVGQGKVDVEAEVKSIEEPRSFNKFGKSISVANAMVTDGSGEIKLTLWNDDIDKVKAGSKVKITNGFVNEFQGEKQLTSGKFGKLEILDGNSSSENSSEQSEETEDY
ncbi:DNA-binding protein [Candidatus Woesearchaeota archaeon CG10_big_fil_rev_8_21_14_0_10_34_12]|nr:MAG: DNA-binding protein [Candidatus Woesearchaeota archaeon CG10_big_fil_rev_8_21_14_0_10_34_12]